MRSFTESPDPPFRIGAARTEILAAPSAWAARFAEERAIVCRDVFEPALLDRLLAAAAKARFREDRIRNVGQREVEDPQRIGGTINLLLQRPDLFQWLQEVTSRTGIAGAEGQLHQSRPGSGDALDWHDDMQDPRRTLGVTIGFTDVPYSGGLFELRRVNDPSSARAFKHSQAGTILIFDVGRDIEHRLLPVETGGPRRVYGGGFTREPILSSLFGDKAA